MNSLNFAKYVECKAGQRRFLEGWWLFSLRLTEKDLTFELGLGNMEV